ncbi:MAG: hypothetical protein MJ048_00075 [Acidaminococcaceae bacterium]|nr:hypothetical protein [Acidaminococcaceae bacterium]
MALLGFACAFGSSKIMVLSAIVFLLVSWKKRSGFQLIRSKISQKTFISVATYLVFIAIASLVVPQNDGFKLMVHFLEMFLPFLLVGLFSFDDEKSLLFLWRGIMLGTFCHGIYLIGYRIVYNLRPYSWVGSANDIGGMCVMTLFMILAGLSYFWSIKQDRKLAMLVVFVDLIALITTYSRGSIGSFAISLIGILALAYLLKLLFVRKVYVIIFSVIVLCGGVWLGSSVFLGRNYDDLRVGMRYSACQMFVDHPLAGVGFGNYGNEFGKKYTNEYNDSYNERNKTEKGYYYDTPHCIYWYYLSQGGVIGTIGVTLMIMFQIYSLAKSIIKSPDKRLQLFALCIFGAFIALLIHGWVDVMFVRRNYKRLFWLMWGFYCLAAYLEVQQDKKVMVEGK